MDPAGTATPRPDPALVKLVTYLAERLAERDFRRSLEGTDDPD